MLQKLAQVYKSICKLLEHLFYFILHVRAELIQLHAVNYYAGRKHNGKRNASAWYLSVCPRLFPTLARHA